MLLSGWRFTLMSTAGLPLAVTIVCTWRNRRADRRDVAEANRNSRWRVLDNDLADLFRRAYLAADEAEHELMIVLEQAGRIDQDWCGEWPRECPSR